MYGNADKSGQKSYLIFRPLPEKKKKKRKDARAEQLFTDVVFVTFVKFRRSVFWPHPNAHFRVGPPSDFDSVTVEDWGEGNLPRE